jgi:hypothetical protein
MLIQISEPVIDKIMRKLFFILFVFSASQLPAQTINWQQTRGWRIYDLHDKKGMRTPIDSLKNFRSIALDDDSVKYFLTDVREIHHGDEPVWMGAIIVSCIDSSAVLRKVDVSVYGGFFYDEQLKKYFQLRDNVKQEWVEYLESKEMW